MYKYFEKIPLMLTEMFSAHIHKFMTHVHALTWVGSQLKEPKGFVDNQVFVYPAYFENVSHITFK
jgi:hypothetical protein